MHDYDDKNYIVPDNPEFASSIHTISFFSGAGGLDIGAQLAGSKVISSLDFNKHAVNTLQSNPYFNHTEHMHGDISEFDGLNFKQVLEKNNPEKLILIGGPPCQPFSKAGYWVTHDNRLGSDDPRNMVGNYLRMASELRPNGFLLENVESLAHPKNKHVIDEILESLDKLGYSTIVYKANAIDFGVPQKRKRIFIFASLKEITSAPTPTHGNKADLFEQELRAYERVIDWIGKFDKDELFEKEEVAVGKTYYHELTEVPPGKNYIALTAKEGYPNPKFVANKRFWSFLLKLHPELPSWTIAAQPGPWVGPFHWNNRRLRVPEIAAIQTFPENYKFAGSRREIQRQIGNAVPPLLGKAMMSHLMEFV
ncbi:DNA methylase, C-5 cytosine-specific family [Alteromonas infernus]